MLCRVWFYQQLAVEGIPWVLSGDTVALHYWWSNFGHERYKKQIHFSTKSFFKSIIFYSSLLMNNIILCSNFAKLFKASHSFPSGDCSVNGGQSQIATQLPQPRISKKQISAMSPNLLFKAASKRSMRKWLSVLISLRNRWHLRQWVFQHWWVPRVQVSIDCICTPIRITRRPSSW